MSASFPLTHAGDIAQLARWLHDTGRPVGRLLDQSGLPEAPWKTPNRVVAYTNVVDFIQTVSCTMPPDIALRATRKLNIDDLGDLGTLLLGAGTVRQALITLQHCMRQHITHEVASIAKTSSGVIYRHYFAMKVPREALHFGQQYAASLIRALCLRSDYRGEPFDRIEMSAHPTLGFAHVGQSLGPVPTPCDWPGVSIFINNSVLDSHFPPAPQQSNIDTISIDWSLPQGNGCFSKSVQAYIDSILEEETPSARSIADTGQISLRTLQRRLAEDGTSFSALLDDSRRRHALNELSKQQNSIGEIASNLGYANTSALTRSVRRWIGASPQQIRKRSETE